MDDAVENLASDLLDRRTTTHLTCLILGGPDTGKTTLITALAQTLARQTRVAVIDADIGQSHIGPPTTVGWAMADPNVGDLTRLPVRGLGFVGGLSPPGRLLPLMVTLNQAALEARDAAPIVLVDTGGYIQGPAARALWWNTQRMLNPGVVLAVQKETELAPVLSGLDPSSAVYRLQAAAACRTRSRQMRRQFRRQRLLAYFRHRQTCEVGVEDIAIQVVRPTERSPVPPEPGTALGLIDGDGRDLGIGVALPGSERRIRFLAPPLPSGHIHGVILSDARLGQALGLSIPSPEQEPHA